MAKSSKAKVGRARGKRAPSVREVAAVAGVSAITVSRALRGSALVTEAMKEKVERVARKLGYVRNPLAGALMSEMRRSRTGVFRGVLSVLDLDGPEGRSAGANAYHAELTRGAMERARELGFVADLVRAGQGRLSVERIDGILRARGIRGIFILPVREQPELTRLDWRHFSGIYADYLIERPRLHAVCADHYRGMLTALEQMRRLGYRRPGLVLNAFQSARLLHRATAAYEAYQTMHEDTERRPPLLMWKASEGEFAEWFRATGCDAVLSPMPEVLTWMKRAGAKVPETHGFCLTNLQNSEERCAGLDLQPGVIGERSIEMLISMVLRNERGIPDQPMTTLVPSKWVDGPTVRSLRAAGEVAPVSGVWAWAPPAGRRHGEYAPPRVWREG